MEEYQKRNSLVYILPLNNQRTLFKNRKLKSEEFWACMCQKNNTVTCVVTEALSKISKNLQQIFEN